MSESASERCGDLDRMFGNAWTIIEDGAVDRRVAAHTPTLATTGRDGFPNLRTVVVRHASKADGTIRFHTDVRSSKVAELKQNDRCCLHVYDKSAGMQLRFDGHAELHHADIIARRAWDESKPMSRKCYRQVPAPGQVLATQEDAQPDPSNDGFGNFCAVVVNICNIDLYALSHKGHRRVVWNLIDGRWTGCRLAP